MTDSNSTWDVGAEAWARLAHDHGTPFFVYDADAVKARIEAVRDAFQGLVQVYYAVKSNPALELLRAIRDSADGLDISSTGELELASIAGFAPARLSFAGPAKSTAELALAIERRVGCICVESMRELSDCIALAGQRRMRASVALRVNPLLPNRTFGIKMGGRPVQFGIDEEMLGEALAAVRDHAAQIDFRGLHIYAGSQGFEAAGIVEGVENTLRIAREVEARTELTCAMVNLGGGFGVGQGERRRTLDISALADALLPTLSAWHEDSQGERKLVFELGRYLTNDAGLYVTRVIGSKASRGKQFFLLDGGLHHHLSAAGTFGTALRANHAVQNLSRPDAPPIRCTLAGPSCNPTDLLGVDVDLPRPEPGDLIGIEGAGSYGLTASPLLFLGRPTPAEWIRHRGEIVLSRRPRTMIDFL